MMTVMKVTVKKDDYDYLDISNNSNSSAGRGSSSSSSSNNNNYNNKNNNTNKISFQCSDFAEDGIVVLGQAHTVCLVSQPSPQGVSGISVLLNTDRCRPQRMVCRPLSGPVPTPLSFRRSVRGCSGLSVFRKCLRAHNASALASCRPVVVSAVLEGLCSHSFPPIVDQMWCLRHSLWL